MIDLLAICLMIILAFMTLGYIIAQLKKDTTVIDIFWGAGFISSLFFLFCTPAHSRRANYWSPFWFFCGECA